MGNNIFSYNFLFAGLFLAAIVIVFNRLFLKRLLLKVDQKWHSLLTLVCLTPSFLCVFFFTMQGVFDATFTTVFSISILIPRIIAAQQNRSRLHQEKFTPFLVFTFTVIIVSLFRFGAEWLGNQPYQVTNSLLELFNWPAKIGWSEQHIPLVATRSLISGFILTGLSFLFYGYNFNTKRKKRQTEEARLQAELSQVQLESLYAQINPQFLHYSLNNIADLALQDGAQTREKALELSHYFRYCINKEKRDMVLLQEEADMTKTFLHFEQQHFNGQLDYTIHLPEDCDGTLIPRLLLQSLVDISIRQAESSNIENLAITIEIQHLENSVSVLVHDNGAPFPENFIAHEEILRLRKKLDLILPDNYILTLRNTPRKEIDIQLKNTF